MNMENHTVQKKFVSDMDVWHVNKQSHWFDPVGQSKKKELYNI